MGVAGPGAHRPRGIIAAAQPRTPPSYASSKDPELNAAQPTPAHRHRILVAGIGNIFLADDGFGPETAAALLRRRLPETVRVADFGIRGMDLAYQLLGGYDAALLLDATPHGEPPGTLSVIEPDPRAVAERASGPDPHAMDPVSVLALAHRLGDGRDGRDGRLPRVLVVGCEPEVRMTGDEPDVVVGLSDPVRRAVDRAVPLVETLLTDLLTELPGEEKTCGSCSSRAPSTA
jgi:hydrogenase maturation protease